MSYTCLLQLFNFFQIISIMLAANSVLFLLVLFTPGCYGDEHFSHLVLLDELPAVFGTNATPDIVIRTNYSVSTLLM